MIAPYVNATNLSDAWLKALATLYRGPERRAIHTIVTIADPVSENHDIRLKADQLLDGLDLNPIETVANTIFPAHMAATSADHKELVTRYRAVYPLLKARWRPNQRGTYFGRLVAYPTANGDDGFDQLGDLIRKLSSEHAHDGAKTARYETSLTLPGESDDITEGTTEHTVSYGALLYAPDRDRSPIGFPCLSHCSFQLDRDDRLHLLAHYRSQYLVERAYGNYMGLGRLLMYVSEQSELQPGQLTVVAGYAQIDSGITKVRALLSEFGLLP